MYKESAGKWLRLILVFSIANLTIIYTVPNVNDYFWRQWVLYALQAANLYCFFHLMKENRSYRWAVIFITAEFVLKILNHLISVVFITDLMNLIPGKDSYSVLSSITKLLSYGMVIAGFLSYILELWGHSALVDPFDPAMAKKWKNLFFWNLGAGLLTSGLSWLLVALQQASVWDMAVYKQLYPIVNIPTILIKILYMLYLWKTIQKIKPKEDIFDGN